MQCKSYTVYMMHMYNAFSFLCFIGSKVIAYVDKQLLPAASIRHVDCEVLFLQELSSKSMQAV